MKNIKKIFKTLLVFTVILTLIKPLATNAASGSLSGPGTIRSGDQITISVVISGSAITALTGNITYDKDTLSYVGYSPTSGWNDLSSHSGNNISLFVANEQGGSSNSVSVAKVTFRVKDHVAAGTKISVNLSGTASDSAGNESSFSGHYSANVAAALSSNNFLNSLSVSGFNISPNFSAPNLNYTLSVPFSTTSLAINAKVQDRGAKVSISNNKLAVNATTNVKITVSASNGSTRVYTISTFREQDPNYIPNDNSNLSNITVNNGVLSPHFNSQKTRYIVYLPYETTTINITATPEYNLASYEVVGPSELEVGQNYYIVYGVAEDGSKKEYNLEVIRAKEYGVTASLGSSNEILLEKMRTADLELKQNFILDLRNQSPIMSGSLLEKLEEFKAANLIVLINGVKLTFNSQALLESEVDNTDAETNTPTENNNDSSNTDNNTDAENSDLIADGKYQESYDLSFLTEIEENTTLKRITSDNSYTFQLSNEATALPLYTIVSIDVPLDSKNLYNVYRYANSTEELILVAKELNISELGAVSFSTDQLATYIITDQVLENAQEDLSVTNQLVNNTSDDWFASDNIFFWIIVISLACIVIIMLFVIIKINSKKRKLEKVIERNEKREKTEDNITEFKIEDELELKEHNDETDSISDTNEQNSNSGSESENN
ncbi:MAG: cadherin-like beta sandwich domain-containing protein [Erysipelotrichaceae bacterium]